MNDWTSQPAPTELPGIQLYCLPHAGGGTAIYHRWRHHLPAAIRLLPVQLPGRESRFGETAISDLPTLVDRMDGALQPGLRTPFALFGHSMGGLLAFEWARRLRRAGRGPCALFVSACPAPHRVPRGRNWHLLPDEEMIQALLDSYGDPNGTGVSERQMMQYLASTLRADLTLVETYQYHPAAPLDCPIITLRGSDDAQVASADASAWRQHTSASCEIRAFPGHHFFLRDHEAAVAGLIGRKLLPFVPK